MYGGLANLIAYLMALVKEIAAPLFTPDSGGFAWQMEADGCWTLISGKLPELSDTGREFANAVTTVFCNVTVFLAQVSALLPAQPSNQ